MVDVTRTDGNAVAVAVELARAVAVTRASRVAVPDGGVVVELGCMTVVLAGVGDAVGTVAEADVAVPRNVAVAVSVGSGVLLADTLVASVVMSSVVISSVDATVDPVAATVLSTGISAVVSGVAVSSTSPSAATAVGVGDADRVAVGIVVSSIPAATSLAVVGSVPSAPATVTVGVGVSVALPNGTAGMTFGPFPGEPGCGFTTPPNCSSNTGPHRINAQSATNVAPAIASEGAIRSRSASQAKIPPSCAVRSPLRRPARRFASWRT